jgi:RNA polymerase sigma factor (sigma-70 family)
VTAEDRADPASGGLHVDDIEAVYREYATRCHALALRIVRDRHLAQDVVQDVFTSMVREPHRFDPARGTLSTWLMTLTHHKAVDLVRSSERKTGRDTSDDLAALVADLSATPEALAIRDDERSQVRTALRCLSEAELEVIALAYFGGYTQSEIAARTATPLGTVKSRTLGALRRLRHELEASAPARPAHGQHGERSSHIDS